MRETAKIMRKILQLRNAKRKERWEPGRCNEGGSGKEYCGEILRSSQNARLLSRYFFGEKRDPNGFDVSAEFCPTDNRDSVRFLRNFKECSQCVSLRISLGGILSVFVLVLTLVLGTGRTSRAQSDLPLLDLSQDSTRQVVIAPGTAEVYQGHPYSVLMPDQQTLFVVWCLNHGGHCGPMAKSSDGGLTWSRLDDRMPPGYKDHINCPSIYRLVNAEGKAFLWVFSSQPFMARIVSDDDGETWKEKEPLGFPNVMAFSSIVPKHPEKQDGQYLGFYHARLDSEGKILNGEPSSSGSMQVMMSETSDAGMTWSAPVKVAQVQGKQLCEPFAFWSPDQQEICCIMRENTHQGMSMIMFSQDQGQTWSKPTDTCWELTGDRHIGTYVDSNGRLLIAFRDQAPNSPTRGHFVAWVGTYDDLKNHRPGQFRVKLLHSFAGLDCGYPGVHLLDDGTVIALTYIQYWDDERKHSVVATRFTMEELDAMQEQASSPKTP